MYKSEKFWNRLAKNYNRKVKKSDSDSIKAIENTKKYLHNHHVALDYGCATGLISRELSTYVNKIKAIDISSKMIDIAKSVTTEQGIENIDFEQASIFDEKYKNESFDAVLAFSILHLLEDTSKSILKIHELLKPGGVFISATPCLGQKSLILSFLLLILSKIGLVPTVKMLTISELENLVLNANFQIVETEILSQKPSNYFIVAKAL